MRGFMSSSNSNASKTSSEKQTGDSMSSISSAQPSPITPPPTTTPPPAPQKVPVESSTEKVPTAVIGPKIRFKGELFGEEDLLIQGQVDGTIDLKDNSLTIGRQGIVKANVVAKTVTIEGTVEGDLFGQERISILASSNVKGNVVADRVILEDGAKFRGSIDMNISSHKEKFDNINGNSHSAKSDSQTTTQKSPTPQD